MLDMIHDLGERTRHDFLIIQRTEVFLDEGCQCTCLDPHKLQLWVMLNHIFYSLDQFLPRCRLRLWLLWAGNCIDVLAVADTWGGTVLRALLDADAPKEEEGLLLCLDCLPIKESTLNWSLPNSRVKRAINMYPKTSIVDRNTHYAPLNEQVRCVHRSPCAILNCESFSGVQASLMVQLNYKFIV